MTFWNWALYVILCSLFYIVLFHRHHFIKSFKINKKLFFCEKSKSEKPPNTTPTFSSGEPRVVVSH